MQQSSFISRPRLLTQTLQFLEESPVTVLLGARQAGKTTLAHMAAQSLKENTGTEIHLFDLERAPSRAALSTPEVALDSLKGLIIIDEIQRLPGLFETLRPLSDRKDIPARFLVRRIPISGLQDVAPNLTCCCFAKEIAGALSLNAVTRRP